jgi:hypothetical protein
MENKSTINLHDKQAPYWAAFFIFLLLAGVSTTKINLGDFWKGYVLDMTGPAWTYILVRGLFTARAGNAWTRFFTPLKTFVILLSVAFAIEMAQFFEWYEATFDPWDFVAYVSVLAPIFLIDILSEKRIETETGG